MAISPKRFLEQAKMSMETYLHADLEMIRSGDIRDCPCRREVIRINPVELQPLIKHSMPFHLNTIDREIEPTKCKMLCSTKEKYSEVTLSLIFNERTSVAFAEIEMHNGTYADKKAQFPHLKELGEQIAQAWNEKYNHH